MEKNDLGENETIIRRRMNERCKRLYESWKKMVQAVEGWDEWMSPEAKAQVIEYPLDLN